MTNAVIAKMGEFGPWQHQTEQSQTSSHYTISIANKWGKDRSEDVSHFVHSR